MVGAARLSRARLGITPTILHFWADVPTNKLTGSSVILFDSEAQKKPEQIKTPLVAKADRFSPNWYNLFKLIGFRLQVSRFQGCFTPIASSELSSADRAFGSQFPEHSSHR